jgi:hypothetical protein
MFELLKHATASDFLFMLKLPRPSLLYHHSAHGQVSVQFFSQWSNMATLAQAIFVTSFFLIYNLAKIRADGLVLQECACANDRPKDSLGKKLVQNGALWARF